MTDDENSARTLRVDSLARVEGEGGLRVEIVGDELRDVEPHLRAASFLRGVPPRPEVHGAA